jgi:hypothetical protein
LITAIFQLPVAAPVKFKLHVRVMVGLDPLEAHPVAVILVCPVCCNKTVAVEGKLLPEIAMLAAGVPVFWATGLTLEITGQDEL